MKPSKTKAQGPEAKIAEDKAKAAAPVEKPAASVAVAKPETVATPKATASASASVVAAFEQGRAAARAHIDKEDAPWATGSAEQKEWLRGYKLETGG